MNWYKINVTFGYNLKDRVKSLKKYNFGKYGTKMRVFGYIFYKL